MHVKFFSCQSLKSPNSSNFSYFTIDNQSKKALSNRWGILGPIPTRPPDKSAYWKIIFFYFSSKTYVVGTQKNRLKETVL